ncbi:MAG: ABC transporter substrate-binding protein [Turicibacter sp.]|nr:ABC transporter substrate-binding protein [Turicibacter sp.]
MKKGLLALLALFALVALVACGNDNSNGYEDEAYENGAAASGGRELVTITDFEGNTVEVMTNPTVVAIYDFGVLDILYHVGFERTGIETLILPGATGGLPASLSYFDGADFVHNGGTLFYVDRDVLDLVQPELVILGARSFGMNAAGDRLEPGDVEAFREETLERYEDTAWIRLGPGREINILDDMAISVNVLSAIFPDLADDLQAEFDAILDEVAAVNELASASDGAALFVMMMDSDSLSVFHPGSRFNILYDEFGFTAADPEASLEFTDQHGFEARAEYVLALNPDIIFVLDRSNNMIGPGAAFDTLTSDPIIAETSAAQNDAIIALDPTSWYTITGGFGATRQMIADMMNYLD